MVSPFANPGSNDTVTSKDCDDGFKFDGNSESYLTELTPELQTEGFQQELKSYAATWILKTKENQQLSQIAMDGIIEDVTTLIQFIVNRLV